MCITVFRLAELTCESHELFLPPWSEGQRLAPGWPGAFLVLKIVPEGVCQNMFGSRLAQCRLGTENCCPRAMSLDENCVDIMHWSIPEVGRHIEQGRGGRVTKLEPDLSIHAYKDMYA